MTDKYLKDCLNDPRCKFCVLIPKLLWSIFGAAVISGWIGFAVGRWLQ